MIYFILVLIALAGAANAVMDRSSEGKLLRWGDFWDKNKAWYNKWKYKESPSGKLKGYFVNTKALWYYLWLYNPMYKERFFYSSTLLVALTDGWHLAKLICFASIFAAMGLCAAYCISHTPGLWTFVSHGILYRVVFGLSFTLFYNKILVK